jgi:hypothetical protein
MSLMTKSIAASLVAATLIAGSVGTAEARGGRFIGGLAAGAVGGLILGSAIANANQPNYYYGGPAYYREPAPVYYAPVCHKEWRYDRWGNAFRVRVCD